MALGLAFVAVAPAQAAVTIGELSPPGSRLGCEPGQGIVQTSTASRSDYRVPVPGGVITEWSTRSTWGSGNGSLQLVLAGYDVSDDKVTYEGLSQFELIPASAEDLAYSFKTRIPVDGNERLGLYAEDVGTFTWTCAFGFVGGPANRIIWGTMPQPVVGAAPFKAPADEFGERVPVEAKLEADLDKDGFGDETQDLCPTSAATQSACPVPPVPDTTITKHPKAKTKGKGASFKFTATVPGATFECKLDKGPFKVCTSPHHVKVGKGKHTFSVRAIANGQVDATPATFQWKIERKKQPRRPR